MADRRPPHLVSAAQTVLATLDTAGIPACLIGGMVVSRWGQPRATTDTDVTALAPYGDEAHVLDILLARFEPRRPDARAFALDSRVLLISSESVSINVALSAFPFEIEAIDMASSWEILPTVRLRTCPAEHLIVYKLVAARLRDLGDMEGIVRRQGARLDAELIRRWGSPVRRIERGSRSAAAVRGGVAPIVSVTVICQPPPFSRRRREFLEQSHMSRCRRP